MRTDGVAIAFRPAAGPGRARVVQALLREGVGPKALHGIQRRLEGSSLRLAEVTSLSGIELKDRLGLDARAVEGIASVDEEAALAELEELRSSGVSVVHVGHALYPERLVRRLGDRAPAVLFCLGDPRLLGRPGVGFAGARNGSAAGLSFTREMARSLAESRVVISGHAKGSTLPRTQRRSRGTGRRSSCRRRGSWSSAGGEESGSRAGGTGSPCPPSRPVSRGWPGAPWRETD